MVSPFSPPLSYPFRALRNGLGWDWTRSPGRFFAANELKTMMAFLVLNYDVRFAEEGKRPANIRFGPADLPSHNAKVMFRKRRQETVGVGAL